MYSSTALRAGGSLAIELPRSKSGSRWRWADRKTGALEDRLPEVLEGLASRAAEDRTHAEAAAQAAAERQVAREKGETDARARALSQFYADSLYRQVEAFQCARAVSAYCEVLEQRIEAAEVPEPDLERATARLAWARTHATEIDPFRTLPTMPEAPEFTPKELEAFMVAISLGPNGSRFRTRRYSCRIPARRGFTFRRRNHSFGDRTFTSNM